MAPIAEIVDNSLTAGLGAASGNPPLNTWTLVRDDRGGDVVSDTTQEEGAATFFDRVNGVTYTMLYEALDEAFLRHKKAAHTVRSSTGPRSFLLRGWDRNEYEQAQGPKP